MLIYSCIYIISNLILLIKIISRYIIKINKKSKEFLKNNEIVLKKLGRIKNIFDKESSKASASLVIGGDIFKLYFEENVDLNLIKENLISKQRKYVTEMDKINSRLRNKNFVDRAPKYIVDQEKTNYNNLKKDIKKKIFIIFLNITYCLV